MFPPTQVSYVYAQRADRGCLVLRIRRTRRLLSLELAGRAGAQLVLIVMGVTLALWADAWVTSRMDREIEPARLESLDENVERTLEEVRDQVAGLDRTAGALRREALR